MKRFMLLIALCLFLSVPLVFMTGCGQKEQAKEEVEQIQEEAAEDTAAAVEDTTVVE